LAVSSGFNTLVQGESLKLGFVRRN